jgi:hypothetical protein
MFPVLPPPIIRSTIKTAAVIGTVHVSVWLKSVERCPRSGVYFTVMAKLGLTDAARSHKYKIVRASLESSEVYSINNISKHIGDNLGVGHLLIFIW